MASTKAQEVKDPDFDAKMAREDDFVEVAPTPSARMKREPPELVVKLSPEERAHAERALTKKIDLRLLPMLILMYIMNYLDRNNIAAARLAGLVDSKSKGGLGLTSTQYLTALSILFVGYLLMQIPSNLFLNKIGKPSLYLPTCMIVWGVISAATAGAHSYGGLIAIRFFLGFVEAAYFPGCLFFLSSWYTRKELGFRIALLYSGSLLSGAFSGLISAGITNGLDGARGLRAWRWLFIIEGVITIFFAFLAYFALPDFPRTTTWLTEEERQLAVWRLDEDIGEDDWVGSTQQTFFHGMKLAFQDIKMWNLVRSLLSPNCLFDNTDEDIDGHPLLHRIVWHGHESLPHCCCYFGLLEGHFASSYCPAICIGRHHNIYQLLARRPHWRTIFSYHFATVLLGYSIHHRRKYDGGRS